MNEHPRGLFKHDSLTRPLLPGRASHLEAGFSVSKGAHGWEAQRKDFWQVKGRRTDANGGLNWEVQSKGGFLVIALRII